MDINYIAVVVATVVQFIIGAIWYMPLFGGLWGRIHGFETHSPEVQAEMKKGMAPLLIAQFVVTLVTTVVFSILSTNVSMNLYYLAFLAWLGFVVPTQVAGVIFGGTAPQWIAKKIAVMAFGALACFEAMALVMSVMS